MTGNKNMRIAVEIVVEYINIELDESDTNDLFL